MTLLDFGEVKRSKHLSFSNVILLFFFGMAHGPKYTKLFSFSQPSWGSLYYNEFGLFPKLNCLLMCFSSNWFDPSFSSEWNKTKSFCAAETLDTSEMWNGTDWMAGPVLPSVSIEPCIGDRGDGKIFIHIGVIWQGSGKFCKLFWKD